MDFLSKNTGETKKFAENLSKKLKPGDILALYGDLGSGKTTFVRFLTEALGLKSRVQSPTFVLIRKYSEGTGEIKRINHIDLYRLTGIEEVRDLGLAELFSEKDSLTIIEWPELAEEILPENTIKIKFDPQDETIRKIYVQNLH